MKFDFTVSVEVSREQGKFASREDIAGKIQEALDDANPGNVEGDEGGEYNVDSWDVTEVEVTDRRPKK